NVNGDSAEETEAAFSRADELCRRRGESPDLVRALGGLTLARIFSGALHKAREESQEMLEVAGRIQDSASIATANSRLGLALVFLAELTPARERLEQVLALLESFPELTTIQGLQRVAALAYLGRTLWLLGFPYQALRRTREAEVASQRSTDL